MTAWNVRQFEPWFRRLLRRLQRIRRTGLANVRSACVEAPARLSHLSSTRRLKTTPISDRVEPKVTTPRAREECRIALALRLLPDEVGQQVSEAVSDRRLGLRTAAARLGSLGLDVSYSTVRRHRLYVHSVRVEEQCACARPD